MITTYSDVLTFIRDNLLLDSSYSDEYLMNICLEADALIAQEYAWSFLTYHDSSSVRNSGDTYATAYVLPSTPSGYLYPKKINVGEDSNEYTGVPFEEKEMWRDTPNRFWVDYVNGNFYLTGTENGKTIHHYYIAINNAIDTSSTVIWPAQFRTVTAYAVADILSGADVDADGINKSKSQVFSARTSRIIGAMRRMDLQRSRTSMGGNYNGRAGRTMINRDNVIY